jgi:hypothetical protein
MSKRKADGVADGEVPASRTALFNQDVRALNLQFAAWVEKSKSAHSTQLWDAGIRYSVYNFWLITLGRSEHSISNVGQTHPILIEIH